MKKKNKKRKINFMKILSLFLFLVVALFLLFLYILNILSLKLNILITIILLIILFVIIFFINDNRVKDSIKKKSIIFSIIIILILGFVDWNIFKTLSFFTNITSNNSEVINYSVVTLLDSDLKKVKNLKEQSVGYYNIDSKDNYKLKVNVDYVPYADINKLYLALFNKKVSAIIIEDSLKALAEENNENYITKTKVLHKFYIEEKSTAVAKEIDVTKKPFNIYMSGIDTYGSIASVSRSDVNILITINPNTHKILLTAIPRDYYVKLHSKNGYRDKLTHAGIYGVDESISTIEDLLGIDINYYAKVNFTSVIDIVDALGGVTAYSERSFTSVDGQQFQKGNINMNGEKALAFARERYAFGDGDRQRGRNQEALIKALVEKATSPAILLKYDTLLTKMQSKIETNIPQKVILSLIKMQLSNNVKWEIENNNVDGSNSFQYTYSYPHQKLYVMLPDEKNLEKVKNNINIMLGEVNEGI